MPKPLLVPLLVSLVLASCGSDTPPHIQDQLKPRTGAVPPPQSAPTTAATPDAVKTQDTPAQPITTESDLLKEVGYLLKGVQNLDQALAAREQLSRIGQRAQPLIDKHKQAFAGSPADLAAFAQATKLKLSEGLPLLQAELDRIAKIPGAREALELPMTKIMGILNPQL